MPAFTASIVTYAVDPVWGERYHLAVLVWQDGVPVRLLVRRHAICVCTVGTEIHAEYVARKLRELRALQAEDVPAWLNRQGLGIDHTDVRVIGGQTLDQAVIMARSMLPPVLDEAGTR